MFELIALGVAGAAGIFGFTKSRSFVRNKLRYTKFVEKPWFGVAAGVGAAVLASPLAILPLVTTGTALVFGVGVGTGTALGARDAKRPMLEDEYE